VIILLKESALKGKISMKREVESDNTRIMKKKLKALTSVKKSKDRQQHGHPRPAHVSLTMAKKITENNFDIWFSTNKSSLTSDYIEYVYDTKRSNNSVLFFKAWAQTVYARSINAQTN
jgi:hypothetical protein